MRKINYRRYSIQGAWYYVDRVGRFQIWEADLLDKQTGDVFRGGASKVTNDAGDTVDDKGKRAPRWVFAGETAHTDARRVAWDADTHVHLSRSTPVEHYAKGFRAYND